MEVFAPYATHLMVGSSILLVLVGVLWFLRADPNEVDKQREEFYRQLYAKDAIRNSRR